MCVHNVYNSQVGKALGTLSPLLDNFDHVNGVSKPSGAHAAPNFKKDLKLIVQHLQTCNIFTCHQGRKHASFPKPRNVLHSMNHKQIIEWIVDHIE